MSQSEIKQIKGLQAQLDNLNTVSGGSTSVGLMKDLISYWRLDETSSTRFDRVGSNHLTDNNTVSFSAGVSSLTGNAANFTATNSEYLQAPNDASLQTGDIDITLAFWSQINTFKNQDIILKWSSIDSTEWAVNMLNTGVGPPTRDQFIFSVQNPSSSITTVTHDAFGSISTGVYYFVVCWHDSTANTINIQLNNGAIDSVAHSGGIQPNTGSLVFGNSEALIAASYFDGNLDEVGFWKRLLTTDEKTFLYNSGFGRRIV